MSPYYNLANAIIVQAVKDYRKALRHYNRDPQKDKSANEVAELECFFTSEWFEQLSDLNGRICRNYIDSVGGFERFAEWGLI